MALAGSILGAPSLLLPLLAIVPFVCLSRRRCAGVAAPRPPVQLHHGLPVVVSYADALRENGVLPVALAIPEGV
jgi:hypothetical protein